MNTGGFAAGSATVLGMLTAVSPCMLATTIAAISFLARRFGHPRHVLVSAALYVVAQTLTYVAMAGVLVGGLLSTPVLSQWLRMHMLKLVGPFLLLAAPFLLEWLVLSPGRGRMKQWAQTLAVSGGLGTAALLGMLFAMSFCPTTAALFFGGLIPLAVTQESPVYLPLCYALGVSLPVCLFAGLIAIAANKLGRAFQSVTRAEWWLRRATGALFLGLGLYFTLAYTLDLV